MESSKKIGEASDGEGGSSGSTPPEDVEWLASLSEFELDFLISLKEMAMKRTKIAGYKYLGDKFDARMLRALGDIVLEYLKDRIQNTSLLPNSDEILTLLSRSRLAAPRQENLGSESRTSGINASSFVTLRQKRMFEVLHEERPPHCKKQKIEEREM